MKLTCIFWAVVFIIACVLPVHAYEDDFEREMEQLFDDMAYEDGYLDESNNPADSYLKKLDSLAEIDNYLLAEDDRPAVIGYFDITTNKQDFDVFEQLAQTEDEHYRFGYTLSKEVLEEKHYSGCTVHVHPVVKYMDIQYEKLRTRFPFKNIPSLSSLKTFVYQKALPLVGEMTPLNEPHYRNAGFPVVTIFTLINHANKDSEQNYQALLKRVRAIAAKFKKLKFNVADAKTYWTEMDQKYGFEKAYTEVPISVGLREGSVYYVMPQGEFTEEKMERFLREFLDGKLEGIEQYDGDEESDKVSAASYVGADNKETSTRTKKNKQAKAAADLDRDSQVIALTDLNAKSLLSTPNVDIFVEFFAPWCVHCQKLTAELRSTANAFKQDDGIIVTAMDATENQIPAGFKVEGYPTLYFVPANNKQQPVLYAGSRQAGDMVEYLTQHRTTSVERGSGLLGALLREEKSKAEL